MKIIISPAKTLDYTTKLPVEKYTEAMFLKQAEIIQSVLKEKSPKELSEMMHISDNLAQLNYERNQEWELPFDSTQARPAVYAFKGDVYIGLDAYTIDSVNVMQDKLRILSGLYGLLRPLDLILPYRLEMGTNLPINNDKNLYHFWKNIITEQLNQETKETIPLINLASKEYSDAVDFKKIKAPVIHIEFKEFKDGKYKTISFFAKKARGMMARYIIENNLSAIEQLKFFNIDGYQYDDNQSSENKFLFVR
ncbi:MAG: peroxide stress protein YaaA [Bacteroidota bacterium]|nr:peroxide stress protein YaaA [Bacteroidota bacterium]